MLWPKIVGLLVVIGAGMLFGPASNLSPTSQSPAAVWNTGQQNTEQQNPVATIAVFRVLRDIGILPAFAAGHSLGEYSAHVAAGTFTFRDAVRVVRNRGAHGVPEIQPGCGTRGRSAGARV